MCQKPEYQDIWQALYSFYGLILSANNKKQQAFYVHETSCVSHFDLLTAAFYYHQSTHYANESNRPLNDLEIYFLKKAINKHSVHALQRYIGYLYEKAEGGRNNPVENKGHLLIECIKLCKDKTMLELYGSYTYMMLAESYFRYAKWIAECDPENMSKVNKAVQASLECCEMADKLSIESANSIENASFGKGLSNSNTLGFSTPGEAKSFIETWEVNRLGHLYKEIETKTLLRI